MAWYEHARIFYDWIRFGEDLSEEYADHLIQKTIDLNCDTLAFCCHIGGCALWNSRVSPKYNRIGQMDLIGSLSEKCKKNKLRFVPWWLGTSMGVAKILYENPDWALLGARRGKSKGKRWHYICYNTPYRDILFKEVEEVLKNYKVDGIYFDQLPGSCYCPECKKRFKQKYGTAMPNVPGEEVVPLLHKIPPAAFPAKLKRFREDAITRFCRGIRKIINRTRPGTCYAQNWIHDTQSRLGRGLVDVVLPEFYQKTDLAPLGMKHRITKTYFDSGPIWGNVRHSVRHDARHFPVRGTQLLLMDCLANHASPLMLDLCAMDFDSSHSADLAKTFGHISEAARWTRGARPVNYAALLHSLGTWEQDPQGYLESFEGMYRLLFENHIPFEIINEASIKRGDLAKYKVLVLPDTRRLGAGVANRIIKRVQNGMGLFASHQTPLSHSGLHNALGIKTNGCVTFKPISDKFDKVLAIPQIDSALFYYGSLSTRQNAYFSFQGGFVQCESKGNSKIIANIHDHDHSRLKAAPYNRRGVFPGDRTWPLVITNRFGKGRTAYFASQTDALWRRAHAPELERLMLSSIKALGSNPPIEPADVPKSVEIRLLYNKKESVTILLLVNLTTNPLVPMGMDPGVVRYVTPQKGIRIGIKLKKRAKSIKSVTGLKVRMKTNKDECTILVPKLDLYDCLVIHH